MSDFAPNEFERAVMRMVAQPNRMMAAMETMAKDLDTLSVSNTSLQQFQSPKWREFHNRFLKTLDVLRNESLIELTEDDVWGEPQYCLTESGAKLLKEAD
jgi:hypothetical protein